jgi:hypothetical protein
LSTRSAVQESLKTRPEHYKNGVFSRWSGAEESAKEFFNRLFPFHALFVNKGKKRRAEA